MLHSVSEPCIHIYLLIIIGWPDIGYHFVIGGDNRAYVGRNWNRMGGHTKNMNRKSIGIAFLGNYQKHIPERRMLDLVSKITDCGVEDVSIL